MLQWGGMFWQQKRKRSRSLTKIDIPNDAGERKTLMKNGVGKDKINDNIVRENEDQ